MQQRIDGWTEEREWERERETKRSQKQRRNIITKIGLIREKILTN